MSLESIHKQGAGLEDYTPSAAKTAGQVELITGGRAGAVDASLAASEKGALVTEGKRAFLCAAATTFAVGDPVFWDASANLAVTAEGDSADFYVGVCVATCGSTATYVMVQMNVPCAPVNLNGLRGVWVTRPIVMDHADTASYTIITAAQNPDGLNIDSFFGIVTEQPAGSSEDQLVITLYDEDDNALATLTTTNTSPDAAGDLIQGSLGWSDGTTGEVAPVIPAGKSAYVKVSQATAGTPAGAVKVQVKVFAAA